MYYDEQCNFDKLKGKIVTEIKGCKVGSDEIRFICNDGSEYLMYHVQDCCESVTLEDIAGDVNDLINSEIMLAEEVTSNENPEGVKPEYQDSFTWTFYKLRTINGSVTLRWYGESNGYYSESVDFAKLK